MRQLRSGTNASRSRWRYLQCSVVGHKHVRRGNSCRRNVSGRSQRWRCTPVYRVMGTMMRVYAGWQLSLAFLVCRYASSLRSRFARTRDIDDLVHRREAQRTPAVQRLKRRRDLLQETSCRTHSAAQRRDDARSRAEDHRSAADRGAKQRAQSQRPWPRNAPSAPPARRRTTPNKMPRRPPAARRACPRPRSGPRPLMPF